MPSVPCEWFPTLPSGTWADWATASVALLAFFAAVWAGRAAWSQNKATLALLKVERQREDRAERAEEGRRAADARGHQADRVAVWTEWKRPSESAPRTFVAVLENHSFLPVYDVQVTFVAPDDRRFEVVDVLGVLPPGQRQVIAPAELLALITRNSDETLAEGTEYFLKELIAWLRAEITFEDTTGRCWRRDQRGGLSLFTGDEFEPA